MRLLEIASFARLTAYIIEVGAFAFRSLTTYKNPHQIGKTFAVFFLFAGAVSLSQVLFSFSGYLGGVEWMFLTGQILIAVMPFLAAAHLVKLVREVEDLS